LTLASNPELWTKSAPKTLIRILKSTINSRPKRCCNKKRLQVETNLAANIRMKSFTELETRQSVKTVSCRFSFLLVYLSP
jgi:hypothetical protein